MTTKAIVKNKVSIFGKERLFACFQVRESLDGRVDDIPNTSYLKKPSILGVRPVVTRNNFTELYNTHLKQSLFPFQKAVGQLRNISPIMDQKHKGSNRGISPD